MSLSVAPPQRFAGRYAILREIGVGAGGGASGQAFLAQDTTSGAHVVLKLSTQSSDSIYQIRTESRVLQILAESFGTNGQTDDWDGQIPVPILIQASAQPSGDSRVYLVEEFVQTPLDSLVELVRRRTDGWSPFNALEVADALARMLELVHANGVIHGDLNDRKPEHVFWDPRGRTLKVIDWGIADFPGVLQRRHLPRSDIDGVGGLLHYMLTGNSRERGGSVPDWAGAIIGRCGGQRGAFQTATELRRATGQTLSTERLRLRQRVTRLYSTLSTPISADRADSAVKLAAVFNEVDPFNAAVADSRWLVEGPADIDRALERLLTQLRACLALFSVAAGDPSSARLSAAEVAVSARDVLRLVSKLGQTAGGELEVITGTLPARSQSAVELDWDALAGAFDEIAHGRLTPHAPNGPSAEPWATFERSLLSLDLPAAAALLAAQPGLLREPRRASDLRDWLLRAHFRIHPLLDVERFVLVARRRARGLSGDVPADVEQRWTAVLDDAWRTLAAIDDGGPPGKLAASWDGLADAAGRLALEFPGLDADMKLSQARQSLDSGRSRFGQLAESWRAGEYGAVGVLARGLAHDFPELGLALADWTTDAPSTARRAELVGELERVLVGLEANPSIASGAVGEVSKAVRLFRDLGRLDPAAPWLRSCRSALHAFSELAKSESELDRRAAWRGLAEVSHAVRTRRTVPGWAAHPRRLRGAVPAAARFVAELTTREDAEQVDLARYEELAAKLGPFRSVFDPDVASFLSRCASLHVERGRWAEAAQQYGRAVALAERTAASLPPVHPLAAEQQRRARTLKSNAAVARVVVEALEGLADGKVAQAAELLRAIEQSITPDPPVRRGLDTLRRLLNAYERSAGAGIGTAELEPLLDELPPGEPRRLFGLLAERLPASPAPRDESEQVDSPTRDPEPAVRSMVSEPSANARLATLAKLGSIAGLAVTVIAMVIGVGIASVNWASWVPTFSANLTSVGPAQVEPAPTSGPLEGLDKALLAFDARDYPETIKFLRAVTEDLKVDNPLVETVNDLLYQTHLKYGELLVDRALHELDPTELDLAATQFQSALDLRTGDEAATKGRDEIPLARKRILAEQNRQSDDDAAIAALEEIMKVAPDYWRTRETLYALLLRKAYRLWEAGDREGAHALLRRALEVQAEAGRRIEHPPTPVALPPWPTEPGSPIEPAPFQSIPRDGHDRDLTRPSGVPAPAPTELK